MGMPKKKKKETANRDSRDAPNTPVSNRLDSNKALTGSSPGSVGADLAGDTSPGGDGKASPESRSQRKPRKPKTTVPTGAINSLIAHCEKTCDAKRRGKHPWTYLENAVNDVKKWINEVL